MRGRLVQLTLLIVGCTVFLAQAPASPPRIRDDAALADWATPVAAFRECVPPISGLPVPSCSFL
jgi:hypothetical protein